MASQRGLREFLAQRFPNYKFLGEEDSASHDRLAPDAPPTWIVDPLDGTTNYVHDIPLYCISIGLHVAGEIVVGVVYEPSRRELFTAAKGLGAWLGGRRLQTSHTGCLDESLLVSGVPYSSHGRERAVELWQYFLLRARSVRATGSTALNLAYLAAGRFDGYWAFGNEVWDIAGGMILLQEAGGMITNIDGSPFDPYTPDTLASNGALHPVLLECLRTKL